MGSGSTRGWSGTAPPVIPRSLLPPKTRERDAAASCPSQSPSHAPFPRFGGQKGIGGDRGIPNKQLDKNSADPAAFPVGCGDAQREFKEVFLFLFSRTQAVASLRARRRNPVCTKPQARLEGQRPRRKHRTTHFKKSLRSPGVMYSLSASIHNTVTYCKKVAFGVVPLRNNLHSGGAGASSRPSVRPCRRGGRLSAAGRCAGGTRRRGRALAAGDTPAPRSTGSAGRAPGRACLSAGAGCTPAPPAAPACRSWTRSGGRSTARPRSPRSAGRSRLPLLRGDSAGGCSDGQGHAGDPGDTRAGWAPQTGQPHRAQ